MSTTKKKLTAAERAAAAIEIHGALLANPHLTSNLDPRERANARAYAELAAEHADALAEVLAGEPEAAK